jgi:hypothetical protein
MGRPGNGAKLKDPDQLAAVVLDRGAGSRFVWVMVRSRSLLLVLVTLVIAPTCGKRGRKAQKTSDNTTKQAKNLVPGLRYKGLGRLDVGGPVDEKRLQSDGPDKYLSWRYAAHEGRVRYTRAYPISSPFGGGKRPTYIYLREEIWTQGGRVVHLGQAISVVKKQCTPAMATAYGQLAATVKACMVKGALVLRLAAGKRNLVNYLCERGRVSMKILLRPVVPTFEGTRETQGGVFSVSQFLKEDVSSWLRKRFSRAEASDAKTFFAELAPITKHLGSCPQTGKKSDKE